MFGKKKKEDEFQTGLEAGATDAPLMAPPPAPSGASLSAIDIQQQEFRLAFRGYNEKDVDEFLDQITEAYTALSDENRRLRSGNPAAAGSGDAAREAEEIKTAARMEADRILREARAQAAAGGAPAPAAAGGTAGVSRFLNQEREFLQGMAGMIQQHAETIRATAKEVQDEVKTAPAPAATPEPAPTPEAVAPAPAPVEAPAPPAPAPAPSAAPPAQAAPEASASPSSADPAPTQQTAFGSAWAATMASETESPQASVAAPEAPAAAAPTVTATEPDTVVAIPPSAVDTQSPAPNPVIQSESVEQAQVPDAPAADTQQQPKQPQDQRSLRELFWGED